MDQINNVKVYFHSYIYWGILMVINIAIIVWFYNQTLRPKYAIYKIFLLYYLCNFFNAVVFAQILEKYNLKMITYLFFNAAVLIFLFSGGAARKLISGLWIFIAQMLGEIGGFCVVKLLNLDISAIAEYTMLKNLLVVIDMPLQWLLCVGFLRIQKGFGFQLDKKKMWLVIKCYFCEMVTVCMITMVYYYFDAGMSAILLLSKFLMFAVMLYLVVLMKTMEAKQLTENKTKYLQQQSRLVLKYCNDINEKTAGLEGLREEYEKKLKEVYAVVDQNRKKHGEDNLRTKIKSGSQNKNVIASQVSNGFLEQLAADRELAALLEKGSLMVKLDFTAIPAHLDVASLDLSALLYNMLENAYEAVERQLTEEDSGNEQPRKRKEAVQHENDLSKEAAGLEQQRRKKQGKKEKLKQLYYIKADAKREADRLTITVKNSKSPQQKISVYQDQWKTSKENKKIHGYGMGIIKSITEKYHGEMAVDYGQDWFENKVVIKTETPSTDSLQKQDIS